MSTHTCRWSSLTDSILTSWCSSRSSRSLLRLAQRRPKHYPVFDLVHAGGDVTGWPYER
ncbi:hypothetical protein [Streptomyces olivaceoviridis]|uniref:hypothetical protein n=1 Tax=Streptomyces olivaceoviridis TaxID=1921 RepID=UPI00378D496A